MKRNILSPADAVWLTQTIARNAARFGGYTMKVDDGDTGGGDAGGDVGGDQGDQGSTGGDAGKGTADDKGFPANTPVAEMNADQRAAYWEDKAKKHEGRNKEILGITGGKYGDELRTILEERETLRQANLTDAQRQVEEAARTAREEATREFGPKSVRAAFDLLLGDMPEEERNAEIELLDLSKFLTQNGDVDTAKVRTFAQKIAPAVKGAGERNYGQGQRGAGSASGLEAGRSRYKERRGKSASSS